MATRGAAMMADVQQIPRAMIEPNPHQHRRHFDEEALQELARSLAAQGCLQNLVVRKHNGGFQIVAGERRFRAAAIAGIESLPCRVVELTDAEALKLSITENVNRENVTPLEEADGYGVLRDEYGMTAADISAEIGKSAGHVQNRLALTNLGQNCRRLLEQNFLGIQQAVAVARIADPEQQFQIAKVAVGRALTGRQTLHLVQSYEAGGPRIGDQVMMFDASEVTALTPEEDAHRNKFARALESITNLLHDAWDVKQQEISRKLLTSALRLDAENLGNLSRWCAEVRDAIEAEIAHRDLEKPTAIESDLIRRV